MRKLIFLNGFILILLVMSVSVFAEVNLSPADGTLGILTMNETVVLDGTNTKATISDAPSGTIDVSYSAATDTIDLSGVDGHASVTFAIAKIYLKPGDSARIEPTEGLRGFTIENTSEKVIRVILPDGSLLDIAPGAKISLTPLADTNYDLSVLQGSVEYTDPTGRRTTLDEDHPAILVQGFGIVPEWRHTNPLIPGWRIPEPQRHPATP